MGYIKEKMLDKLIFLYGKKRAQALSVKIEKIIYEFQPKHSAGIKNKKDWLDESDIMLITYGDQIKEDKREPLGSLEDFLKIHLKDTVNSVHIISFYPYSSDDGFSVTNYFKVNPGFGKWKHIKEISDNFNLMFDAVINHISVGSKWFKGYLEGESQYDNFFIEVSDNSSLSMAARPRTSPLITRFRTSIGEKYIWTTFSSDQVDLNYKNEKVLIRIIRLLLFYISRGARFIRLDAAGYLWKEKGTRCIHLEKTHKIIQLIRCILEIAAPGVILVTETNAKHKDNVSYLGNGHNEAHMVYQFPLPPLVLDAFYRGDASHLLRWAGSISTVPGKTAFLNFLASHDGIGIIPVTDILSREEISEMTKNIKKRGGHLSYKTNNDGTRSVYELNINYFDAISDTGEEEDLSIKKFICSQAILLSLAGVPGIYIHSLLGTAVRMEGKTMEMEKNKDCGKRSISRKKFIRKKLEEEISDHDNIRHKVFNKYKELIKKRTAERAFHPDGEQKIIYKNKHIFAFIRTSVEGLEKVICLHNVSKKIQRIKIKPEESGIKSGFFTDIISEREMEARSGILDFTIRPYEFLWLKAITKSKRIYNHKFSGEKKN